MAQVICATSLDVQRQIVANSAPVTQHQQRALEEYLEERKRERAGRA